MKIILLHQSVMLQTWGYFVCWQEAINSLSFFSMFGEHRNWNLNAEVNYSILSFWQLPLSQAECVFEACGGRICWDSSLRGPNIRKSADRKHASPNTHKMKLIWSACVTWCALRRWLVRCEAIIMPYMSVWMEGRADELSYCVCVNGFSRWITASD